MNRPCLSKLGPPRNLPEDTKLLQKVLDGLGAEVDLDECKGTQPIQLIPHSRPVKLSSSCSGLKIVEPHSS